MYAESLENEWPLVWTVYLVVFKQRKTLLGQLCLHYIVAEFAAHLRE